MAIDLAKPIGPLPLGAWIVVVGAGLGIAYYTRNSGGGTTAAAEPQYVEDVSTAPGVGTGPGWVAVPPPTTAPEIPDTAPTTNEEWARKAINGLIADGYDAATADAAIRKYMEGAKLSIREYTLIGIALAKFGAPPVPLPAPIHDAPTIPAPTPAPAPRTSLGYRQIIGTNDVYEIYSDETRRYISLAEAKRLGIWRSFTKITHTPPGAAWTRYRIV